jgi:signal transduction histidine kinase
VRITLADTGIGISQEELPYLFAKFSRGKDTKRLNTGGTGLGLYVGKQMIENNGGTIWAESDGAGKGSRFIIELPIEQKKEILEKWG